MCWFCRPYEVADEFLKVMVGVQLAQSIVTVEREKLRERRR